MHSLCTAIRTRSVLSHPPGVKPQRPLTLKSNNPCKCIPNIHLQHIKNTHRHSFNTEILAGKTASVCINKNASLQRCSEHELQQESRLLLNSLCILLLCLLCYFATNSLLQKRFKDLLHEGALRALPSNLPTLFNYIEWVV
jgi:hypothetical protein